MVERIQIKIGVFCKYEFIFHLNNLVFSSLFFKINKLKVYLNNYFCELLRQSLFKLLFLIKLYICWVSFTEYV